MWKKKIMEIDPADLPNLQQKVSEPRLPSYTENEILLLSLISFTRVGSLKEWGFA